MTNKCEGQAIWRMEAADKKKSMAKTSNWHQNINITSEHNI